MAMATTSVTSLAMAMAAAASADATQAPHKLSALPFHHLLFSRAPPLLRASRRLPLAPLVASSDAAAAAEAGVEWSETEEADEGSQEEEEEEEVVEEQAEAEEEVVASVEEEEEEAVEEEFAAEPPEEAKVYVGNLPYDVDSEGLAQLFEQAGVVEVAEVSLLARQPTINFPLLLFNRRIARYYCQLHKFSRLSISNYPIIVFI
mgnify:CR=1 FL=1